MKYPLGSDFFRRAAPKIGGGGGSGGLKSAVIK